MSIRNSLKVFSEILDVELKIEHGDVVVDKEGKIKTPLGLDIPVKLEYLASFQSQQVGVVFKVVGDLGLMISHFPKTEAVSVFVLNLSKLTVGGVKVEPRKVMKFSGSLRENIDILRVSIVGSYYVKDGKFCNLTLPT
jgi:hypothetical protein